MKIKFLMSDVVQLVNHAEKAKAITPTYEQLLLPELRVDGKEPPVEYNPCYEDIDQSKMKPQLFLVGDQGLYLMSSGSNSENKTEENKDNHVVYAEGINPEKNDDWYDRKVISFGADDGVEVVPTDWIHQKREKTPKAKYFYIDISPERFSLVL